MQRVTVSATGHTVSAKGRGSATGDYLSSLNEERRHIASPSATGNLLCSIQGYICNICRMARTVEIKNYLTKPKENWYACS